ncbi:Gpi16-domain-containing protein, partial [Nadsonia fulvescens var. elongata DSM 6958]
MLHSVGQVKVPWCLIYICGFLTLLLIVEVSADVENPIVTKTETADYREELTLKPLSKTNLLASFFFETYSEPFNIEQLSSSAVSGNKDSFKDYKHYSTFPRSLGQIIDLTDARELHLRFSQGWWDAEEWGSLPREGSNSGGTGVEAWAFIQANNRMEATTKW